MIGIRERLNSIGGDFVLMSTLGRGTELVITIPHTISSES
jgi:signal transduction histidine kinase